MSLIPDPREATSIIPATASSRPEGNPRKQRRSFFRVIGEFVGFVHKHTAEDMSRLREAAVSGAEAAAEKPHAEAMAKMAEAAERHAKAEELLASANKTNAEADAIRHTTEATRTKLMTEAAVSVIDAASRVAQAGGTVAFDVHELLVQLSIGRKEFPEDRLITGPQTPEEPEEADSLIERPVAGYAVDLQQRVEAAHAIEAVIHRHEDLLKQSLADSKIGIAGHFLSTANIRTLGQLIMYTADQLLGIEGFDETLLVKVRSRLAELGLKLKDD